jgi:glucan phosphoethanolaminetransferase (alkaline phosphatase superfamily)
VSKIRSGSKLLRPKRRNLALLAGFLAVGLAAYLVVSRIPHGQGPTSRDQVRRLCGAVEPRDLNILLITLDTTRADHIGCYGYRGVETPCIDRVAGEGFLFRNATAQAPLTLPSHSSILTGTYPVFNGVRGPHP